MIAKAKSIAHGGVSLGYITRQGKAQVVKLNHLPEDASPQAISSRRMPAPRPSMDI